MNNNTSCKPNFFFIFKYIYIYIYIYIINVVMSNDKVVKTIYGRSMFWLSTVWHYSCFALDEIDFNIYYNLQKVFMFCFFFWNFILRQIAKTNRESAASRVNRFCGNWIYRFSHWFLSADFLSEHPDYNVNAVSMLIISLM